MRARVLIAAYKGILMAKKIHSGLLGLCVGVVLVGCAAPGSPQLILGNQEGNADAIPNCKNVTSTYRVDNYITDFYLTTWGSAAVEGAIEGYKENEQGLMSALSGLAYREGNEVGVMPKNNRRMSTNKSPITIHPFCRKYNANFIQVTEAVSKVLPFLGNKIILADKRKGQYETDFIFRSHTQSQLQGKSNINTHPPLLLPVWKDKYTILVNSQSPSVTELWILRSVYINRSGMAFNQSISVGHNEAWIMTRVNDILNK